MSTAELLQLLLQNSSFQVSQAIAGLSEEEASQSIPAHAMSPRQMIEHLTECCVAAGKDLNGEKHEWGTYVSSAETFDQAVEDWKAARTLVESQIMARVDDPSAIKKGVDFLAEHDFYHVGQLCTHRLGLNPEWNAYSIYGM